MSVGTSGLSRVPSSTIVRQRYRRPVASVLEIDARLPLTPAVRRRSDPSLPFMSTGRNAWNTSSETPRPVRRSRWPAILVAALAISACRSPTEPVPASPTLTGQWVGTASRGPCGQGWAEDWSTVSMTLVQTSTSVTGEVFASEGRRFPVSSLDGITLHVSGLEGSSTCSTYAFFISDRQYDGHGTLVAFSGNLSGRCCGTLAGPFRVQRRPQ